MQLNSDSFCDAIQIWMEVIGHLWAELGFWFFSEKRVKISAAANIGRARTFRQVVPVQQAVTVRQRCRPYKLSGFVSRFHLGTAWRRGNTFWEESSSVGLRRRQSGDSAEQRFQQPPCYCRILWDANIFDGAPIFHVGADISWALIFHGRQYFMAANISWALIFHGRQYFMDANISWPPIFHGRQYFMAANISWTLIFWRKLIFVCKVLL